MKKLSIDTTFVDPDDPENFEKAIQDNTKVIFFESLGNPKINIIDFEAVAVIAKNMVLFLLWILLCDTIFDSSAGIRH